MAKKNKKEKVTSIITADEYGNTKKINLTGNTGGYNYNSKTGKSTPALADVGKNDTRTVKTNQSNNQNVTNDIRTIKTENTKSSFKDATKKAKNVLENSAVKNYGLSVSNIITDLANIGDAKQEVLNSIPGIGEAFKTKDQIKKTAENVATNMGTGALKSVEGAADMASDLVFNPMERMNTYAYDLITKGKKTADENLKDLKKMQQRDIKKSQTENFQKATGYSDIVDDREKNSLVTRENAGGQFAQMTGGMVPQLVLGQALGGTTPLKDLKGLKGKELAKRLAKNSAISLKNQLPANLMLAGQSYGGGLEDALNKGNTMGQSRLYGGTNVVNEVLPELMFGGVPGLGGKGGIDNLVEPILDKGYKGYSKPLVKGLYKAVGEGLEEKATTYLDALARQGILGENINWKDIKSDSDRDFIYGMLMGGFLNSPETTQGIQEVRGSKLNGNNFNTTNNAVPSTQQVREVNEIQQRAQNGEISYEQANQQLAQVQDGTYQQNQLIEGMAKQEVEKIQQAVETGQMSPAEASQEIQAINNTLTSEREKINQPSQEVKETTQEPIKIEKKETKSSDNKAEKVTNDVIKATNNNENGRRYKGAFYKDSSYGNLNDKEIKTAGDLREKIKNNQKLTTKENKTLEILNRKRQGLKNPELKTNNTFEEVKRDLARTKLDNYDEKLMREAKEINPANKQGRRTKQQWLDTAKFMGMQMQDADSKAIKDYSLQSFISERPNTKDNLNRQGKKFVDFKANEWVNAFYEGARVGEKIETKIEKPIETQKVEQPKVEVKEEKSTNSLKEIRQEVEEKTNKTMSKHIETSSKATGTVQDVKNMDYNDIVYDEKSHKASQEQALRELEGKDTDTNVNDIHAKFRGTERLTNVDSAKITELMKQTKELADEAIKNGNDAEYNKRMEQFRTLKGDYAVALSESGQFIEYAKVIKELDPDTQVDVLRKVIEREQRRGNKKYEDVKLNEDLVKKYKDAKTDEEREAIMEEIKDDTARQIKITFADKANEFRFLSMLGNIKTHGRNIFGNAGMYSLQSFKDGVAAIGEDIYNKTSKNGLETRSKTLKKASKEVNEFVNNKVDSFMKDQKSKYNESRGMKGDLEGRTKKFSDNNPIGKALNKASNINSKALDFEDRFFSSLMTKQAMKGFLTANGIETNADIEAHPELVAQALDYALFKGKEATFHQDSTTATAIRNARDKLYTGSGFSKLGGLAIDTTLPFVSTPANIAKNALEYTPIIGFGDINTQFKNAPDSMKANVIIDSLSKQFTGAALMAVGAYLASLGKVKGSGDDDKEDKTEASLGNASYSIKIGNSTYDLSWLSPTAIPFFEGVEVFNALKKAKSKGGIKATDTADLIDTMFGTLNPMADMSVLQSIERVITSIAYGGNAVKSATSTTFSSYLQQYIPTFLSQVAQVGDTKQRNTNTGSNVVEKTWDQIKYKIPGARNTLPEKVDVWGDTNKTAKNELQRGFEAFLSPANRKDYKVDSTTKELERLARETDDTAMLPTIKNKKLTINKKGYDLKGKDYVDLQKTYGKTAKKNLDKLVKSESYKNADDTEKQSMVRKLYDYASYKAKENYAKNKGINFDSGSQTSYAMIDAFGVSYEKYVENKVSGNESASTMLNKLNGAGLSEAQKGAVMNYFNRAYYVDEDKLYNTLENSDLSNKQKEAIKAKYEKNITDAERERYKRADNIGVGYDLYTDFRNYVANTRGESRSGGLTKKQKVINWIQEQELTAQQKYNLYNDYINNQGIFSYYK